MTAVHQLLARVRRRMRLQAALDWGARASLLAAASLTVWVYLHGLGVVSARELLGLCGLSLLGLLGTATVAALRAIPLRRVAKRVDTTHALHDRLSSALLFAAESEPTPFMQAAMADAENAAGRADARRAAPLVRPRGLGATALVMVIAFGIALLHYPAEAVAPPTPPARPVRLAVDPELLVPERETAAELEREVDKLDDPALQELAKELHKLVDDLDKQQLTRKEVFDKLAEIEKKLGPMTGDAEELKRALKKAGAEMGKEKVTKAMADALVKEDVAQAKKELEKLAKAAEERALAKKDQEELARALDRAAKAQDQKTQEEKKRDAQLKEEERKLKEEERRLKKELEKNPENQEAQRQLKRNQRELERLEREKQQRAEQKRQLERLQRELQKAAEQMRQKLSPQQAEQLRKLAEQMGQMENEIKKLGSGQSMRLALGELKEMLRRSGQGQGNPQSGDGQQGPQGQQAQGDGQGQGQGKGDGKSRLRDFSQRAGQGGEKMLMLGEKGQGDGTVILPLPMGPGPGGQGGKEPGQDGKGPGQGDPGDGIGDQHDPNLKGDPSRLAAKLKDSRVSGKQGAGPSRSETIQGSAEKGFASRGYRRVYGDYSSVVEEVMSQERVPPGYRYFVKRYFNLIKPRD
jgi:hypothetical protein